MHMAPCLQLRRGEGRRWMEITARWCGRDLVVTLVGGTTPHVGAVAVAQARPSLRGDGSTSSTTSVFALTGHKEDELARWAAGLLAALFDCSVVVTAGIHVDEASGEEIAELEQDARSMVQKLATALATGPHAKKPAAERGAGP